MNNPGVLTFKCNICGTVCEVPVAALSREGNSCKSCGSTVRMRSMMHALSIALFGCALSLPDFPERKDLVGKGMSDWDGYAKSLSEKLNLLTQVELQLLMKFLMDKLWSRPMEQNILFFYQRVLFVKKVIVFWLTKEFI